MSGASSRLGQQIEQVVAELDAASLRFALIGGLALAGHHVVRATSDVDLLVRAEDAPHFARIVAKLGYRCLHESADATSYLRDDGRLGVLWASRENVRNLLVSAPPALDPYQMLDDLMTVVESLCPVWPDKDIPRVTVGFLL